MAAVWQDMGFPHWWEIIDMDPDPLCELTKFYKERGEWEKGRGGPCGQANSTTRPETRTLLVPEELQTKTDF